MQLGAIPTAVNLAKIPSSHLTQLSSTTANPTNTTSKQSYNIADQINWADTLVSSERGYTKEDAILKQWNKAGTLNLYEICNGGEVHIQRFLPTAQDLQELEASLRQNGIGTDIEWSDLQFDFRGLGFSTTNPTWSLGENDFQNKTDYFASRYAAMKVRIQETFSGEEQQAQLAKLDAVCQSALEELANGYATIIGDFCEKNGVSGEREKVYQAVLDGVNTRIADYEEMLAEESLFSELRNSEDAWLLQDDEYVASLLREEAVPQDDTTTAKGNGYTWSDLDTLGRSVSAMTQWENKAGAVFTRDETEIGLEFARLSMKMMEEHGESHALSSDRNHTVQKLIAGFMEGYMARTDKTLSALRTAGAAIRDKEGFAALDRAFIQAVYTQTMHCYAQTGNVKEALRFGMDYAMRQTPSTARANSYRYQNSQFC